MSMPRGLRVWFLAAFLAAVPSCTHDDDDDDPLPPAAEDTSVSVTTPAGIQQGFVAIPYTLIDANAEPLSIVVQFSTDGGATFSAATAAPSNEGVADLTSAPAPGVAHVFTWDSVADGVALAAANAAVQIRIAASDASTSPAQATANFAVDNSSNTAPQVTVTSPAGGSTKSGLVFIEYALADAEGSVCALSAVEYSLDTGVTWQAASPGPGGDGTASLASAPGGGVTHRFVWNSFKDAVGTVTPAVSVQVRLTATDGLSSGPAVNPGGNFTVNNVAHFSGGSIGGDFPIDYDPTMTGGDGLKACAADARHLYLGGDTDLDWLLQKRRLEENTVVWTKTSNPSGTSCRLTDIAIDAAHVYAVGRVEVSANNHAWHIEKRSASTGDLIPAFGTGGRITTAALGDVPGLRIRIDATYMYLIGVDELLGTGNFRTRIEKRLLSDGSLVTSFDGDGVLTSDVNALADGSLLFAIDGLHMYIVGVQDLDFSGPVNASVRYEKRRLSDGGLESSFGTAGVVVDAHGAGLDLPSAMDISDSNMFVLVLRETAFGSGVMQWHLEKRSLSTGAVVASTTAGGTYDDFMMVGSVYKKNAELYVCGPDGSSMDGRWRVEKRSAIDLSPVTSFDGDGVFLYDPTVGGGQEEFAEDMVWVNGVLYVVGRESNAGPGWHVEGLWP